jgi:hypothetical protein
VDWKAIKTEYITGDISYRKLAEKHKIPFPTLRDKAVAEQWYKQKERNRNEIVTKSIEQIVEKESTKLAKTDDKYYRILDKLFDKAEELVENTPIWQPQMLKDMATTMKYLKECKSIKSDVDIREQEARINKLEAEVNANNKDTKVTVEIVGDLENWSK